MTAGTEHKGRCLCGAVSISATTRGHDVGACHCTMCRRWGGGPLFAIECGSGVQFDGAEHISTYQSSEWAERGFCGQCGTHLYYRLQLDGHYAIPVGLFDDDDRWNFTEQIFIDQKPAFYSFGEQTKQLTGEEVFAAYAKD